MQRRTTSIFLGVLALASAMPAIAGAGTVDLRRDDVIPVVMQDELNFKNAERGDTFRADVTDNRLLPYGTRVEGRVNRVEKKRGDQPAYMDIEFTSLIMPDGTRTSIHATPIPLSNNYVARDKNGRWQAKKGVRKENVVIGTTAGGLILGSLIKKPFEGAILGALAGILVAETDKDNIGDGNIVLRKGSKVGALLEKDVQISWNGSWDDNGYGDYDRGGYNRDGYDRYGYDRNGRYNAKYDQNRSGRNTGGDYDRDGYDRNGYDREGRYNPKYDQNRAGRNDGGDYDRDGYDRNGYDRDGRYNARYDQNRTDSRDDLKVEVDRKTLRYSADEKPYRANGTVMVPLISTADQIGVDVSQNRNRNTFTLETENDVLRVEQDSKTYRLNNRSGTLSAIVETRDGVTYVPVEVFSILKRGTVYVNGTRY